MESIGQRSRKQTAQENTGIGEGNIRRKDRKNRMHYGAAGKKETTGSQKQETTRPVRLPCLHLRIYWHLSMEWPTKHTHRLHGYTLTEPQIPGIWGFVLFNLKTSVDP
jgi:hypothetical protein